MTGPAESKRGGLPEATAHAGRATADAGRAAVAATRAIAEDLEVLHRANVELTAELQLARADLEALQSRWAAVTPVRRHLTMTLTGRAIRWDTSIRHRLLRGETFRPAPAVPTGEDVTALLTAARSADRDGVARYGQVGGVRMLHAYEAGSRRLVGTAMAGARRLRRRLRSAR